MGTYDRSDPLRSQNQQREERGGSDFLIIIFSYNAGYAKRRGVEKPSFLVLGVFKAASAQSELWRPVLQELCILRFLHTFFLLLICYSIRFITTTV